MPEDFKTRLCVQRWHSLRVISSRPDLEGNAEVIMKHIVERWWVSRRWCCSSETNKPYTALNDFAIRLFCEWCVRTSSNISSWLSFCTWFYSKGLTHVLNFFFLSALLNWESVKKLTSLTKNAYTVKKKKKPSKVWSILIFFKFQFLTKFFILHSLTMSLSD